MVFKSLRQLLDLLLFSNVFIACCTVAQAGLTYLLLDIPVNSTVLITLGCATLALYNFSMILAKPPHPENSPYRRVRWIFRHEVSLKVWTGVALAVSFFFGVQLHLPSFLLLGGMGALGLAYNLPFLPIGGRRKWAGLRQIAGVKLFYIGGMWALSTVLLPVAEGYPDGSAVAWPQALQLMAWVFLYVVAITIPFDIRDSYQDRYYGLKTIPVLVGERRALALSGMLLALHIGWVGISAYPFSVRAALCAVSLLTSAVILFPGPKKNEYYYFFVLDGLLIVQFVVTYATTLSANTSAILK